MNKQGHTYTVEAVAGQFTISLWMRNHFRHYGDWGVLWVRTMYVYYNKSCTNHIHTSDHGTTTVNVMTGIILLEFWNNVTSVRSKKPLR
jgi:hypothetical protein